MLKVGGLMLILHAEYILLAYPLNSMILHETSYRLREKWSLLIRLLRFFVRGEWRTYDQRKDSKSRLIAVFEGFLWGTKLMCSANIYKRSFTSSVCTYSRFYLTKPKSSMILHETSYTLRENRSLVIRRFPLVWFQTVSKLKNKGKTKQPKAHVDSNPVPQASCTNLASFTPSRMISHRESDVNARTRETFPTAPWTFINLSQLPLN